MAAILVIDPDPGVRRSAAIALEYADHEVLQAVDRDMAIRLVQEIPFDLIVADFRALGDSGTARWVRDIDRSVPVVALCTGGRGAEFCDAASLGADRLLAKPFRARELLAVVTEVLARRRSPSAAAGALRGAEHRAAL